MAGYHAPYYPVQFLGRVIAGAGKYQFRLSGNNMYGGLPGTINAWFEIHPDSEQVKKEILAVSLTAISLGKKVDVYLIPGVRKSILSIFLSN